MRKLGVRFIQWLRKNILHNNERFSSFLLYSVIGVILYLSLVSNIIPEKLEVSLYSVADRDIVSPVTIENKQATIKKQNEAAEEVEPEYTNKEETTHTQIEKIEDFFDSISKVHDESAHIETDEERDTPLTLEEKVANMRQLLDNTTHSELSDEALEAFLLASGTQLNITKEVVISTVSDILNNKVTVDELTIAKEEAETRLQQANLNESVLQAAIELAQLSIVPNYFIDTEMTKLKRQQVIDSVNPVMIRQGQVIVREGQIINRDMHEQLEIVGLLDDSFNVLPYIGLALIVVAITCLLVYFLRDIKTSVHRKNHHLLLFITIFLFTTIVLKITSVFHEVANGIGFLAPVAMGAMLVKLLINERIALASSLVFALMGSIIFNNESIGIFHGEIGLYFLFSSFAAIFYLGKHNARSKILKAGFVVSIVNITIVAMIYMLRHGQIDWFELGMNSSFAAVSGFLAAVLTLGLMPFFEAGFGIISTMKLIELSNPNHPLLRKLLTETPGTYHHSVMVANLAEAACEAIGANGLLARVGSYYHDIGKTRRPNFFIENQMNMENPHDKLTPQLSKRIIIAHAYDGAKMLREHKLPKEIVDIAEQHHGTTLLKYFYHKASSLSDEPVPESDYRYPGPKAQTKEAAIIGIADGVEAAVRSHSNPTPEKIESLVRKIINNRLEDGQFDECDLTFRELDIVADTICQTLQGIFHSRIEYPDDDKKG